VSTADSAAPPRRERNRRGQGDRLREDLIVAAIAMVEENGAKLTLRSVARSVGIAATSVYLHFPDIDHLLDAVVVRSFARLTATAAEAAKDEKDPAEQLRKRCRAYCRFGLEHPNLYRLMFQADLPLVTVGVDPAATPGRRALERLVATVERCLREGLAPAHDDPFRLAALIWTAEHGIVLARISRPTFPWAPIDSFVDEMVDRIMGFHLHPAKPAGPAGTG
jgi:AcrR family transcriptional regulator